MTKLRSLKIILASLSAVALVCSVYMLIFGIKSTMDIILEFGTFSFVIGFCLIIGLVLCTAIYMIATSDKGKEQAGVTGPTDLNEQKVTLEDVIITDELKKELEMICNNASEKTQEDFKTLKCKLPKGYLFMALLELVKRYLLAQLQVKAVLHL